MDREELCIFILDKKENGKKTDLQKSSKEKYLPESGVC